MRLPYQITNYITIIAFSWLIGNGLAQEDKGLIPLMAVAGLGIIITILLLQKDYMNNE